jgi:transposase
MPDLRTLADYWANFRDVCAARGVTWADLETVRRIFYAGATSAYMLLETRPRNAWEDPAELVKRELDQYFEEKRSNG